MADLNVDTADILWNGKLVGKQHSDDMLEILKNIDKNQTGKGYGFQDYTFDRGMAGWKAERTMRLGLELRKLLQKMQQEGLHVDIDIPTDDKKDNYTKFYSGPNLQINENRQYVTITGIAHLNSQQLVRFMEEADKVYCQVMDVDFNEAAINQL
jgi:hypothetical protein